MTVLIRDLSKGPYVTEKVVTDIEPGEFVVNLGKVLGTNKIGVFVCLRLLRAPEPVGEAHEHDWSWWYVNANPEIAERFRYCRSCNLREDAQSVGEADPRQEADGSLVCCDERRAAEADEVSLTTGKIYPAESDYFVHAADSLYVHER